MVKILKDKNNRTARIHTILIGEISFYLVKKIKPHEGGSILFTKNNTISFQKLWVN